MRTKTFEHKGQMISYYNKVRKDTRVGFCTCGLDADLGYFVSYAYLKK